MAKQAINAGELPNYQHRPGKEPTGAAILKNIANKMHASVVMAIYRTIGGEQVLKNFDFKALSLAFRLYSKEFSNRKESALFDVNNVWYLAKELKEKIATMETCRKCYCQYFHSINQRMNIDCPFCHSKSK